MTQIKTRSFQFGNEKEGSWPPLFGTGGSGVYHVDRDSGKVLEGPPPPRVRKFGRAPYVIQDTIEPYLHPAAEIVVESRSALRDADRATGTITVGSREDLHVNKSYQKEQWRKLREDRREARKRAINDLNWGAAPITEEVRAKCAAQDEILSKALNFDAFSIGKHKPDERGKRYRRR